MASWLVGQLYVRISNFLKFSTEQTNVFSSFYVHMYEGNVTLTDPIHKGAYRLDIISTVLQSAYNL